MELVSTGIFNAPPGGRDFLFHCASQFTIWQDCSKNLALQKCHMRKAKQETREEKICRWIRNLNRGLAQYPDLLTLQKRRAELEAQLHAMPLEERLALVPRE